MGDEKVTSSSEQAFENVFRSLFAYSAAVASRGVGSCATDPAAFATTKELHPATGNGVRLPRQSSPSRRGTDLLHNLAMVVVCLGTIGQEDTLIMALQIL